MAKSTKAEVQKRIRIVLEMLLQSTPRVDIVQYAAINWGITEWGTDKYIAQANKIMMVQAKQERDEVYAANLAQRRYIKNKAIKAEDYRLAHEVLKDEAKLLDLYPAEKHEHKGEIIQQVKIDVSDLTDSELDAITNLAARLGNTEAGEAAS